jgi:hypothetical protein
MRTGPLEFELLVVSGSMHRSVSRVLVSFGQHIINLGTTAFLPFPSHTFSYVHISNVHKCSLPKFREQRHKGPQ